MILKYGLSFFMIGVCVYLLVVVSMTRGEQIGYTKGFEAGENSAVYELSMECAGVLHTVINSQCPEIYDTLMKESECPEVRSTIMRGKDIL